MTRLAYYVVPYYRIYSNSPYTRNMYHACGWLRDFLLFVSHRLCAPFICYRCYFLASYAYIFKQILSIWIRVKLQEPTENRARERERERDLKERGGEKKKKEKREEFQKKEWTLNEKNTPKKTSKFNGAHYDWHFLCVWITVTSDASNIWAFSLSFEQK